VVTSLQCNPTTLGANASGSCTVALSKAAGSGGVVASVSSTGLAGLTIPGTVTVEANATTGTFPISTGNLSANQNGSVTASYNSTSQSVNLTLSAGMVISSLQCNQASLGSNASSACTVTLSAPAPSGGALVVLSTTLSNMALPRVAAVPAGSTTGTFTISTFSISSNQTGSVTATYNGSSQSTPLTLTVSAAVVVSSLQCSPTTLGANASGTCTVTLSAPAPQGGASVTVASGSSNGSSAFPSPSNSFTMPSSVMVAANATTASFPISTGAVSVDQNGLVTASYNGSSQSVIVNLVAPAVVSLLQCAPTTLGPNANSNCTVTLSKAASGSGVSVVLGSSGLSALTVPATVMVTAGSTAGPFTVSTGAVGADQNGTLTASYNGTSQSVNMNLTAATVISSLQCNPTTLGPNASSNCTVTLSKAASGSVVSVVLSSSGLPALTVPATVTVTAGSTTGPFTVSTGAVGVDQNGTLTASYNGTSQSVNVSLAAAIVISSLQCNPTTLGPNASSNCTVTLSKAVPAGGVVVTLNSSGLPALTVPASVTVAAGAIGLFTVSTGPLGVDQNGTVTASYNGTSQSVNVSLAAAAVISSLQCSPTTLGANTGSNCTVTLSKAAPAGSAVVGLTNTGLPGLSVPSSVTVAVGSTTAPFTVSTGSLSANQNGTLTATYNGSSQSVAFSLSATTVISSLQCSPTTIGSQSTSNCTVTLSAPASSAALIVLSSSLPNVAYPRVTVVPAGSTTVAFTITTFTIASNITGPLTATYNGSTQCVTLNLKAQ
jgi:trimeric autotransporter adhesin